jgi:prepilin-type N-terminal cleavage/methylation domain-containing protein
MGPLGEEGFSLVELLVTVVILVTLAVVVTPSIVGARDADRVISSARWLDDFAHGIYNPDSTAGSFRADLRRYPGALEHLTRQIQTTDVNSCGVTYNPGDVIPDKWRGPYLNRVVNTSGIPIGIGTVRNQLTRDHASTVRNSVLRIHVDNVIIEDAMALDARVDLSDGEFSGTVQWDPTTMDADGFVTVNYLMNVSGC